MSRAAAAEVRISEKEFQAQVVELAETFGWLVYHTYDSRRSQRGFPDLTMVRRDRVVFAELKSDTGQPTIEQRLWMGALSETGRVECYCWRPGDWDAVEATLR